MDKTQLRKMIKEEVQRELYKVLPSLLKTTVNEVMTREIRRLRRNGSRPSVIQESLKPRTKRPELDRSELQRLIGYGDMKPGAPNVGGVSMDGGLMDREREHGVAHMSDYVNPVEATEVEKIDETYEPQFSSIPRMPGGVDGGAEVPVSLVASLGKAAKKTLEEAEAKKHWRPGMPK